MTLTTILAVWGAALSSVAFGWNLYRDLVDRARLKVKVNIRRVAITATGAHYAVAPELRIEAANQLYVMMTVVNAGRRQAMWQGWGGQYSKPEHGKKSFFVTPAQLPKMLREGEVHTEMTTLEDDLYPANARVKRLYAWDTTGKKYCISWLAMRRLRRAAERTRTLEPYSGPTGAENTADPHA